MHPRRETPDAAADPPLLLPTSRSCPRVTPALALEASSAAAASISASAFVSLCAAGRLLPGAPPRGDAGLACPRPHCMPHPWLAVPPGRGARSVGLRGVRAQGHMRGGGRNTAAPEPTWARMLAPRGKIASAEPRCVLRASFGLGQSADALGPVRSMGAVGGCPTQAHRVGVADTHRAVNHHCGEHYTDCELQSQAGGCNAHFRHENFSTVHAPPIRHALQRALRGAGTAAAGGHAQASAAHAARGTGSEGEVAGEEQPRTRAAGNRRRRLSRDLA